MYLCGRVDDHGPQVADLVVDLLEAGLDLLREVLEADGPLRDGNDVLEDQVHLAVHAAGQDTHKNTESEQILW
jgi:hypothetical protein